MNLSKKQSGITIFCSYAPSDREWRERLATHLSQLKRDGLIEEWDDQQIPIGLDRAQVINQAIRSARLILLLISADFLASDACYQAEMQQALERHRRGEARVVPIILRPCDWQSSSFAPLQCLPRNGQPITTWSNLDEAWASAVAGIRSIIENSSRLNASVPRAVLPAIWNIPYQRNPFFMGREDLLSHLHTQLQRDQPMAVSQHPQAISGLGGIGKTQIVVEYAYRFHQEYQVVLWAQAESRKALISSYVALAALLNLSGQETQEHTITVQAVKRWLQTHGSWLLILDNADELAVLKDFLPSALGGHLLITTRASTTGQLAHRIEVETFAEEQGALFLLRRASRLASNAPLSQASVHDQTLAREISLELGGLPLALDQAGAYLEQTGFSLMDYQRIYLQHRESLLSARGGLVEDHPDPVATTWSLSFGRVEQKSAVAVEMLRLCAYLSADAIPLALMTEGTEPIAQDLLVLGQAIETLRAYSFVSHDPVNRTLSIHRLVQVVIRDALSMEEQIAWMQRAVRRVEITFPDPTQASQWSACECWLPHALVCTTWIKQAHMAFPEVGRLLHRTGSYLCERARYAEAEPLYQRALQIREQQLGSEHPAVASSLNGLANLYREQGRYAEAEPLYQRALQIREQQLGSEHPAVASSLSGLAGLYAYRDRYAEAEQLHQRALQIREQRLGSGHPTVASSLNRLAIIYREQGRYAEAEQLHQRSLQIREQRLGSGHPAVAYSLEGLAKLYQIQGKYGQAELLYRRLLHIWEQQLGPEHPNMAFSLNHLAIIYREQGRYAEAEQLHRRSLQIREQRLGSGHPAVAYSLSELAITCQEQGRYAEAEPLFQRALQIREQRLGSGHPTVASSLNHLAIIYREQGKYAEAEQLHQRSLQIREQQVTSKPNDAKVYLHRGYSYLHLKDNERACTDFARYAALQPKNVNAAWMVVYATLSKQHPRVEVAERLEMIATLDPQCCEAYICRGVAQGLRGKLQEGLTELDHALHLNPRHEDALFWKGVICAYLGHDTMARESIEQALQASLPPILLTPLYWLEQDSPTFYQDYAKLLLKRYELT